MIVINIIPALSQQPEQQEKQSEECRCSRFSQCWEQKRNAVLLVRLLFINSLTAVLLPTLPPSLPSQLLSLCLATFSVLLPSSPRPPHPHLLPAPNCCQLFPSSHSLQLQRLLPWAPLPPRLPSQNLSYCPMAPVHLSYCQCLAEWNLLFYVSVKCSEHVYGSINKDSTSLMLAALADAEEKDDGLPTEWDHSAYWKISYQNRLLPGVQHLSKSFWVKQEQSQCCVGELI